MSNTTSGRVVVLAGVVEAELEVAETFGSPVPRADREGPAAPRPDLA